MPSIQNEIKLNLPELKISCDVDALKIYSEDNSRNRGDMPVALVKPRSVKQLRDLVLFCNETGLRLQPISSQGAH